MLFHRSRITSCPACDHHCANGHLGTLTAALLHQVDSNHAIAHYSPQGPAIGPPCRLHLD
jgi:hypothetical protein